MTEVDALLLGHLAVVLHCPLPDGKLRALVEAYPNLVEFTTRLLSDLFEAS